MFCSKSFYQDSDGHFALSLPQDRPLRVLHLTDLHLGFGVLSHKADALALAAVRQLIQKAAPDLMILTGDSIFPFLPKAGTLNNLQQAKKLTAFMDTFKTPYALVFGNHDIEMGALGSKKAVGKIFADGQYSIFGNEDSSLFGYGNYIIKLINAAGQPVSALAMLDSNMYGDGWFFSGFDCIHADQTAWCMRSLAALQRKNPALTAFAFFHMPLAEYKTAYEKMKLGDKSVVYHFGSIGEADDYFGISKNECDFFEKARQNGAIKAMFCGHDHYNTLSLTYKGIRLTYGMSIDYLGYHGIQKRTSQRGATLLCIAPSGGFSLVPVPLGRVVSARVRGVK